MLCIKNITMLSLITEKADVLKSSEALKNTVFFILFFLGGNRVHITTQYYVMNKATFCRYVIRS